MANDTITLSKVFQTSPQQLYRDWLNSEAHSAFTGGDATASEKVGAPYSAWNEYIEGINVELEPSKRIYQSWRSAEFTDKEEDSFVEVRLSPAANGETLLTLTHSNIPAGQGKKYKEGWIEHYFEPMEDYYSG